MRKVTIVKQTLGGEERKMFHERKAEKWGPENLDTDLIHP